MIERSPAVELIEAFANTVDVETGDDEAATPLKLARWLAEQGLLEDSARPTATEHRAFMDLRAGLRDALDPEAAPSPHRLALADAALAGTPVLVTLTHSTVHGGAPQPLAPAPDLSPTGTAMARIAAAWAEIVLTGQSLRLKRCAEHTCGWVFWDSSKNHSRRWCSMRVCGNRSKSRRYAARKRTSSTTG